MNFAKQQANQPIDKNKSKDIVVYDYALLRNLKSNKLQSSITNEMFLPGLGLKKRRLSVRNHKEIEREVEVPRLLATAVDFIKQKYQEEMIEDEQSCNIGNNSSNNFSRDITPLNPLFLHSGVYKKKNLPSHKNKLNSVGSDLHEIDSNPEEVLPKFKHKNFILYDRIIGQAEVVFEYVFHKQKKVNPKLIHSWKDCLSHSDKTQIFISTDHHTNIPYTFPRLYSVDEIEKGLRDIYGSGKHRCLTIGQESLVIDSIQKYLKYCTKDPLKIVRKDFDIIQTILNDCKLNELEGYPSCLKQIETHFKIMATRWKYSGELQGENKVLEAALVMAKNNFVDLSRNNILVQYLMKYSNVESI